MPLPWKKTKVSRISRLVAGLNQSPKHGGSLVVETGFPTSLVDLFVKNKDRLKKPSKKKSTNSQLEISSPVLVARLQSSLPEGHHNLTVNSSSGFEATRAGDELKSSAHVEEVVVVKECDGSWSKNKSLFVAVLKMFVVVALALSTKRLAVGITMSAFLLLMLEYAGYHVLFFLKPCTKARTFFVSSVEKVKFLPLLKSKNDVLSSNEIHICEDDSSKDLCDSCELVNEIELKSSVKEIQVVDSKYDMETRDTIVKEQDGKVDVLIGKKEKKKSANIRAKIVKKFVKLRNTKKGKKCKEKEMESGCEVVSCLEDDKLGRIRDADKQEQVYGDKTLRYELEEEECEGPEVFDDGRTSFTTQSQAEVAEIVEGERKGNSGYLILFLIVLAGLVGGRFLALVITVAWCLVSKLMGRLRSVPVSS